MYRTHILSVSLGIRIGCPKRKGKPCLTFRSASFWSKDGLSC
jgi:hypothetical protein